MTQSDINENLRYRLAQLERAAAADHYPSAESISYIANLGITRAFFMTDDRYSHGWFYPRYSGGGLHEPNLTKQLFSSLTSQSVFVDVGAHLGYFSIIAALRAKAVFAIEPQEFRIGRIHRNIAANHLGNVTLMHAAVGEETGFVQIPKVGAPTTKVGDSTNLVPMIRLDDYFSNTIKPTHIKIDTEGFEYQVLNGGQKLLQSRPVLYIEFHRGMERFGHRGEAMWDMLDGLGYQISVGNHRHGNTGFVDVARDTLHHHEGAMLICQPR